MNTVTMLEIRKDARRIVERLQRGEAFILSYRNRNVGRIEPILDPPAAPEDDPVYRIASHAENLGEALSAAEADQVLYGE